MKKIIQSVLMLSIVLVSFAYTFSSNGSIFNEAEAVYSTKRPPHSNVCDLDYNSQYPYIAGDKQLSLDGNTLTTTGYACGGRYIAFAEGNRCYNRNFQTPATFNWTITATVNSPVLLSGSAPLNVISGLGFTTDCSAAMNEYDFSFNIDVSSLPTGSTFRLNYYGASSCGGPVTGCGMGTVGGAGNFTVVRNPQDFTINCTPASNTIMSGSSTAYNFSTTPINNFQDNVVFTHTLAPVGGTAPGISYVNNNRVPASVTTAIISTTAATTPATYTITFTATSGTLTKQCNVQLIVYPPPAQPSFTLNITPADANALKTAGSMVYNVTPACSNMAGPITGLQASSVFSGVQLSLSQTTVACGGTVTLTVSNLSAIPANELSTPQNRLPKGITVTGTAVN